MAAGTPKQREQHAVAWTLRSTLGAIGQLKVIQSNIQARVPLESRGPLMLQLNATLAELYLLETVAREHLAAKAKANANQPDL